MNKKRIIALFAALFLTVNIAPYCRAEDNAEASYTINNDLDADGNWIYRELVPDIECETLDRFFKVGSIRAGSAMQDADIILSDNNPHSGNYSIKRTMRVNPGIAFAPTAALKTYTQDEPNEYVISAWMRTECSDGKTAQVVPGYTIPAQKQFGKGTGEASAGFNVGNAWQYFSKKVRKTNSESAQSVVFWFNGLNSNNAVYDDTGSPAEYIQTLYIDDWSMRLCVPDGFPETKRLSVDYNEETQTLTYKFNLDIDPRTVRKENIEVNGVRGDAFIESSVLETTDEETREHTLTLKLQNLENENMITVILADVKDAWGREILNNPPFTLNNFPEGQYTIFNDLDDTGAWKYRELIYDPECETTEYLWDGLNGAQPTPPQTQAVLSTDAHSGSYSISRTMQAYSRLGQKIANLDVYTAENPAEYMMNLYAKADMGTGISDVRLVPCYRLNENKEAAFSYPRTEMRFSIGTNWTKLSFPIRVTSVDSIDKTKDIYAYFYANEKDAAGNSIANTIYLDEWSVRRMLPDDFFNTEVTESSYENGEADFTFNLDIDRFTVTKEKILINGTPRPDMIDDLILTTDNYTRITDLKIKLKNLKPELHYTIDLPDVKDAWGRDIEGNKTISFDTPKSVELNAVFKSGGNIITKMTDGEIEIDLTAKSNIGAEAVTVTAAVYKNNKFVNVVPVNAALDNAAKDIQITIDAGSGNDGLRLFIWRNQTGEAPVPIISFIELKRN